MENIIEKFRVYLLRNRLTSNTVKAYSFTAETFLNIYRRVDAENVMAFRCYLETNYSPKSANLHIAGFNRFLHFIGKSQYCLRVLKFRSANYLDNVITFDEYLNFKHYLSEMNDKKWYYIVWTLAATGVRISELVQFDYDGIVRGFIDVRAKGNKIRRVFIPHTLQEELLSWFDGQKMTSGAVFRSKGDRQISIRGIAKGLERAASKAGIDPHRVHPHTFRHLFAKEFLEHNGDLATLADLLGHESLDTTKIYLRRTTQEQQALVDKIVGW